MFFHSKCYLMFKWNFNFDFRFTNEMQLAWKLILISDFVFKVALKKNICSPSGSCYFEITKTKIFWHFKNLCKNPGSTRKQLNSTRRHSLMRLNWKLSTNVGLSSLTQPSGTFLKFTIEQLVSQKIGRFLCT